MVDQDELILSDAGKYSPPTSQDALPASQVQTAQVDQDEPILSDQVDEVPKRESLSQKPECKT